MYFKIVNVNNNLNVNKITATQSTGPTLSLRPPCLPRSWRLAHMSTYNKKIRINLKKI